MNAVSTGAITSDTILKAATLRGVVTYAEATTAAMKLYDGTDNTGVLLATIPINANVDFGTPVQFKSGLFAEITGGTGVVHIG